MKLIITAILSLVLSSLQAEKIIQCIADFPIDADAYTRALQERGYEGKVVAVDLKTYESDLLIRKGRFHQLLRKLNLDYPKRATVPDDVEKIVFFNISPKAARKYDLSRLPKDKLVLFMWEPRTVLRHMYHPRVQQCFSRVYTWNDALVDGKTHFKFQYPVYRPQLADLPSFEQKKLCTLVASDLTSKDQNELYSHRKEAIRYFEAANEEGFEFYGRKWDPSEYKSYRGACPDKLSVIKNYRFCICYENTSETPGYITEKIFDCFAAGVVPIYWGASNVEQYIPKDCFIDRRDFSSLSELHLFMKAMSKETHEKYLASIQAFLTSEVAKQFTFEAFAQHLYDAVVN